MGCSLKLAFSSFKRVPGPLFRQNISCSNRQHHSGVIHKQGKRHEVGHTLCPTVKNLGLVYLKTSNSQSPTYPRPSECGSRKLSRLGQTIQTEWSLLPEVFQTICSSWHQPQIDLCHEVQQQVTSVSPVPDPLATPAQSGGEVAGLPIQQNHSDCSGMAQHALVWGSGGHVQPNPIEPAHSAQPADTALQSDPSQKSDKPKSPCMAPRATAIKEQGFSEAVAGRIEAPQRRSTRSVYEAKWTIFTKWCISNQVDFRAPPVKSVADFLMYLFQDKKLQPSTIDGYRSAIADKLGNSPINISKDDNLTHLLDSFHRDRPKSQRGIASWNLSLILHQLTKAPFEPIKEASLKHLTFKTVFLFSPWVG